MICIKNLFRSGSDSSSRSVKLLLWLLWLLAGAGIFWLLYSFHSYDISLKFKDSASPKVVKIYYDYPFSEAASEVISCQIDSSFSVSSFKKIARLRIDIDDPELPFYDLEELRINNMVFKGRELHGLQKGAYCLKPEVVGDSCRLHLSYDPNVKPAGTELYPDLDYHISFQLPEKYSYCDYFSTLLLAKFFGVIAFMIILLLLRKKLSGVGRGFNKLYRSIAEVVGKYRKPLLCLLELLIFAGIFWVLYSFHSYEFAFKFKDSASPSVVKIYYGKPLSEAKSIIVGGDDKRFSINTFSRVSQFRIDIDGPQLPFYDLEEVRINNMVFSGKELCGLIRGHYYLTPEVVGDSCRLHLDFDPETVPAGQLGYPDLDYHIGFKLPSKFSNMDYYSTAFVVKMVLFAIFVIVFFILRIKYNAIWSVLWQMLRKKSYLGPMIFTLLLMLSFLALRQSLYGWPTDVSRYVLLNSDIVLAMAMIAVFMLYALVRRFYVLIPILLLLTVFYTLCFADCFTVYQFNTRLNIREVVNWMNDLSGTSSFLGPLLREQFAVWGIMIIVFSIVLLVLLKLMDRKYKKVYLIYCGILLLCGVVCRLIPHDKHIFELDYQNLFSYGYSQTLYVPYSSAYLEKVTPFELKYTKTEGKNLQRNVILLAVESLSSYQSKLFSGLPNDNLKNFDRMIQDKNADYSPRYLAASHNTAANTFAILTGFTQIVVPVLNIDYNNTKLYARTLPGKLKKEGYKTHFFSSSSLVDGLDTITSRAAFDYRHDNTDPFYKDKPRYVFNAVHDDVFFKRLVKFAGDSQDEKFFVYAMTISMHAPYYDPRSNKISYDETVRTFDINFAEFVKDLEDIGFFKKGGLLLVTGDHRAMISISMEEAEKMKFFTPQYVPLAIFGDMPYKINREKFFSHVDLHYSLQSLLLKEPEKHQYQRDIFSPEADKEFFCSFYQQLTNPSMLLFNTHNNVGKIRLNGDDTEIICPELSDEERKKVESFLVWMRTR